MRILTWSGKCGSHSWASYFVKKKSLYPKKTYHFKGLRQTSSETTEEAQREFCAEARNGFQFFKRRFRVDITELITQII